MNIAMFTNNYYPFIGGVPVSIYRQAKSLRRLGHNVHIFAPYYPGHLKNRSRDWDFRAHRFRLIKYHKSKVFDYAIVNIFSKKIESEFVRHDFDIVHVHHPFWMGKKGLQLAKKHGIPVVLTYHTRFDHYSHYLPILKKTFKNFISHKIVKNFAAKCDLIFSPSETSREYLLGLDISKPIVILPTGIDFDNFAREPDGGLRETLAGSETLLCSVSRLAREKNIYFLIGGLEYLKNNYPDLKFKCALIGDGPEREEIEAAIKNAGLSERVKLIGKIPPDDIEKYYMVSDIFVFASKSETQGMVLLEAMAGGCPVVAVSSGGIDDIISHGVNGYKTPEDFKEYSEHIVKLINDPAERARMSENARERARDYSIDNLAARAVLSYNEILKTKAKGLKNA